MVDRNFALLIHVLLKSVHSDVSGDNGRRGFGSQYTSYYSLKILDKVLMVMG